jgi:drug/metabolite transporter (DMT)-like permease
MENNKWTGYLLAFLAALLWGVSGACCQYLFEHKSINAEWLVTVRVLISGLILVLFAYVKKEPDLFTIWKSRKDILQLILFSIVGMLGAQYTYFITIKHSNAATATVLQYLGPVLIACFYAFKLKRVPSIVEFVAIIFAMAGTFLLVTHGKIGQLSISVDALTWGLISAVALATYSILPVLLLKKYNAIVIVGWAMLIAGIAFSFVHPPWAVSGIWDVTTYLCTAFIAIFGTLVAFYAYLIAVKMIGAKTASLLACAEPLSAAVIAVIWLNVSFGMFDWMGTFFILATIMLLSMRGGDKVVA